MRHGFLGAIAALMAGAGLAWGQEPPVAPFPPGAGAPYGMEGVTGYPPPTNPEGLATNDVRSANFWFGLEYLGMYSQRSTLSYPVVTTSATAQNGIVGANTTSILYEGTDAQDFFSGGRFTAGSFYADSNRFGAEFSVFVLGGLKSDYRVDSTGSGSPLIARPYVNSLTGAASSLVIAAPDVGQGRLEINTDTQVWGTDAHWLLNLYRSSPQSPWGLDLNVYAGVSFFSLRDSIDIVSSTDYFQGVDVPFNGQIFRGTSTLNITNTLLLTTAEIRNIFGVITTPFRQFFTEETRDQDTIVSTGTVDRYKSSNQFYGGELGVSGKMRFGRWGLGFNGKLGLGAVRTNVEIQGYSTLSQTTDLTVTQVNTRTDNVVGTVVLNQFTTNTHDLVQQNLPGGVYAVNGVIGRRTQTTFAYMPEGSLNLTYQFSRTVTGSLGYNFLYLSKVVRVNDLINPVVDPSLMPTNSAYGTGNRGQAMPNLFPYTSYFIHGVNAGLAIQF